ncbi:Alpha/Beta hydrolase protein, partial [Massariosphaeria phaeospora]
PSTPLVATLPGYGSFQGTQVLTMLGSGEKLQNPVDAWLGVEYSTQPVNESRFAPVTWPKAFNGTKDASEYGPMCIQDPRDTRPQSEACLNFNLYRTSGLPFDERLPIFIFLHGGSFVGGNGRSFDGAAFVSKSTQPLIAITVQYRLGALGSLPSKLMEEEGLLNLGLQDQRMLLEFVQRYAFSFGGDPERVTLGGQSAGGHSVGVHLFHNYGEDEGKYLFSQAILASGSPTARAFPPATYPLYQRQFEQFMSYIDCPKSPNAIALDCLRTVDVKDIQHISSAMYGQSNYNITWPWQPVSPGPLLEKRGSQSGDDGSVFRVPILISSTTDEGKAFAPKNLTTNKHFLDFLDYLAPGLTDEDLADLEALYPDPSSGIGPYTPQTATYVSTQFERISAAYGDYSYICPVQETAYRLAEAGAPVYKARFNTPNYSAAYMGVPHASDAAYFNGVPNVEYPEISDLYSSYYASFIVSGNPNTHAIDTAPAWPVYAGLGTSVLAVSPAHRGGVVPEVEGVGIRMDQCAWWRDMDRMQRLNK